MECKEVKMICKLCNKEMKMRLAKQGKNEGNHFWGCSGYPNCKGVQDATEADVREYNNAQAPVTAPVNANITLPVSNTVCRVVNENQSSYEFGKASNRHKVYYNNVEDLKNKMHELGEAGFFKDDELEINPKDFAKEE